MSIQASTARPLEEYLSVNQVAQALGVNRNTISRRFGRFPGVVDIGSPEKCHKRRHRKLLIPRSALNQFLHKHRVN